MWSKPTQSDLDKIPKLYSTEETPIGDKIIHGHFFVGGCDWYISEFDGEDIFFGFVILNNDLQMAEWGNVSFQELKELKMGFAEVDWDKHWTKKQANQIEKIVQGGGI